MRVWVTGADGFLGRHVVRELVSRGHEVNGDWARSDALVHLAAWANASLCEQEPSRALIANAADALGRARQWRSESARCVFASTTAIYAGAGQVHASTPDGPLSVYAASKLAGEHLMGAELGPRLSVVRMPPLYGPGQRFRSRGVVARWMREILAGAVDLPVLPGAEDEVRDYVYVGDAASAISDLASGADPTSHGRPHLLATGRSIGVRDLADLVCAAAGVATLPLRADAEADPVPHPRHGCYSPSLRAPTPLEVGLRVTAEWWRSNG